VISRLSFVLCLLVVNAGLSGAPENLALAEASGIARVGNSLLIVDDDTPGTYFRLPLRGSEGSLIPIDPRRLQRIRWPQEKLALDPESIDQLADGRIVLLSERLRALIGERGVVAEYEGPLAEFGGHGLEGLAVEPLEGGASRVAVLWEGGYPDYDRVPPQLRPRVGRTSLRPVILVHDLKRGEAGRKVLMRDAVHLIELEVPVPAGAEPEAQRFRAPDLVWYKWPCIRSKERGFIVILSSQSSAEKQEYQYHWLQRFTIEGKPVGEPIDLDALAPAEFKGANWEGLAWFEEGKSLVLIHEKLSLPRLAALVVQLPEDWRRASVAPSAFTHVVARETEYYLSGPQQARPPDGRLRVGTRVTVLRDAGSYCLVRTEQNLEAYVATDALGAYRSK